MLKSVPFVPDKLLSYGPELKWTYNNCGKVVEARDTSSANEDPANEDRD